MSKGMIVFTIIMGWTLLIYGGITYLIVKKKEYSLISGFYNRPEEEKKYLIEHGFLDKLGKVLTQSFFLLLLAFLLTLFKVPFGGEIGFGLFILHMFIGLVYVTIFEVPHKRKKYMWVISIIFSVTIIFIGVIYGLGQIENDVTVTDDQLIISGMYGVEWSLDEIDEVKILDELPEIIARTNGFSTSSMLKGKFRLEDPYGTGRLFVKKGEKPYLYISKDDEFIILTRDDKAIVEQIYKDILDKK